MSGSRAAAIGAVTILIAALYAVTNPSDAADAAEICPPVTMDLLFPPTTPAPPATIPVETTTTTPPATTIPATTSTSAAETTTTIPDATSTTTAAPETTTTTTTLAAETTTTLPAPPPCDPFVYDLAWPLAGAGQIGSPFGADRDGGARKHQGNDIAAPKLTPVVAVADGVVIKVAQEVGTVNCCWVVVEHVDGWQSYYIHLNNDRHGTDDGLGVGARTDLLEGSAVVRGELIGWVGDSGNAEETVDHLHFELHNPEGLAVDPRPSLEAAQAAATLDPELGWPYVDDDGHPGEWLAARLLSEGLVLGCDESLIHFCPDRVAAPDFAAAIAAHLAGKPVPGIEGRSQPLPEPLAAVDPASVEAALGCEPVETCLQVGLPETEVARIAIWIRTDALVATLRSSPAPEGVPEVFLLSTGEAEARLRSMGALEACNPPLDGERLLTRAETILRLVAWVQGTNPEPCSQTQPTF